jgi:hypothetical protein
MSYLSWWKLFYCKMNITGNVCQKLLFLHQLTHNMTTNCSLNYKFNTWKFQALNSGRTCCEQKLFLTFRTISVHNTTSWGCWKHPFRIPGVRPMFLKPKLHKESKNGFKTISCRRYPVMIFSKNCFRCKTIIKNIGCFVDFWIFMAIYMDKSDQFKKI